MKNQSFIPKLEDSFKSSVQKNHDVLQTFAKNNIVNEVPKLTQSMFTSPQVLVPLPPKKKKKMNCYMVFANNKRKEICRENPNAKPTEIAKLLGKAWRDCPDCEKSKYKI